MLWVFILPPREGLFVIKFYALSYPAALDGFWLSLKAIPQGVPGVNPAGSKC